jgi:hypothetical protein
LVIAALAICLEWQIARQPDEAGCVSKGTCCALPGEAPIPDGNPGQERLLSALLWGDGFVAVHNAEQRTLRTRRPDFDKQCHPLVFSQTSKPLPVPRRCRVSTLGFGCCAAILLVRRVTIC